MPTPLVTESFQVFNYNDLERLVYDTYGVEINVLDMVFEPSQRTYEMYEVDDKYGLLHTVGDDEIVEHWIETGSLNNVQVEHVLYRLLKDGHIQEGKYLMTIWW
jgi:hypothetical protein